MMGFSFPFFCFTARLVLAYHSLFYFIKHQKKKKNKKKNKGKEAIPLVTVTWDSLLSENMGCLIMGNNNLDIKLDNII